MCWSPTGFSVIAADCTGTCCLLCCGFCCNRHLPCSLAQAFVFMRRTLLFLFNFLLGFSAVAVVTVDALSQIAACQEQAGSTDYSDAPLQYKLVHALKGCAACFPVVTTMQPPCLLCLGVPLHLFCSCYTACYAGGLSHCGIALA